MEKQSVFSRVDHTLLKATAVWPEIEKLCQEALTYGMATVCIPPSFVKRAKASFPDLKVCTVIGFPLGYNTQEVKVQEARQALQDGADEIDMVVNLGQVKAGDFLAITEEIRALKAVAGEKVLKVIVETCYLNQAEKIALCGCVANGGADFIKTSTGFGSGGADAADIVLFRQNLPPRVRIKASGGIRTAEAMEAMIQAGADRIGASAAITAYEGKD